LPENFIDQPNRLGYIADMPTVLRQDGFAVRIYTNDHLPMHVHILNADAEVLINITEVTIHENRRMQAKDVKRALDVVRNNREYLISEWRRIHG
jgi:microcystin-dependent protein